MPIAPKKGESQSEWMSRCVPEMIGTGPDKRPQEQAVAACLQIWRDTGHKAPKPKSKEEILENIIRWAAQRNRAVPEPDEDESRGEFIARCVDEVTADDDIDEGEAEEACELAWEESRSMPPPVLRHKTHSGTVSGLEFVLSDDTVDRIGDIVSSAGWELDAFKRNPIALFSHRSDFPIGKWHNLRVDKGALRGHLELAPKGTSDRIDEIRKLVDAGILQAVSVGFRPLESQPRKSDDGKRRLGEHFLRQELVETSLVAVPANPNSLAVAKAMNISPATIDIVFARPGNRDETVRRGFTGGHATRNLATGKGSAMSLAQRITDIEAQIVSLREKREHHLKSQDDSNVSDGDLQMTQDLNSQITQLKKQRDVLVEAEKDNGATSDDGSKTKGNGHSRGLPAVYSASSNSNDRKTEIHGAIANGKDPTVIDYIAKAGAIALYSRIHGRNPDETRVTAYGEDEGVKAACDVLVTRAASAPAMTTVAGWAQELAQQIYGDLLPLLFAKSIYRRFAPKGLQINLGRAAKVVIPMRSATPTVAGSFVGEGAPIPVRQAAFTSQTLSFKKMAVISAWTKEMDVHSIPAIEGVIREIMTEDTGIAIDSVLIDTNPATTIRPAGLLNGVSGLTATTGGGLTALIGDIKQLMGALLTPTKGNLRSPVWLMHPADILSISLIPATAGGGEFPFREEVLGGSLNGIPIIDSSTITAKTVILVDAADFVTIDGGGPRFEVSDQATLHFEDTTPLDLATVGTPNTVAAPAKSLFQTDSIALKLVLPMNWALRRTGMVAWTSAVTW
jgi:HK97 family phage prohead protease